MPGFSWEKNYFLIKSRSKSPSVLVLSIKTSDGEFKILYTPIWYTAFQFDVMLPQYDVINVIWRWHSINDTFVRRKIPRYDTMLSQNNVILLYSMMLCFRDMISCFFSMTEWSFYLTSSCVISVYLILHRYDVILSQYDVMLP